MRKLEIELGGAGDAIRRITACASAPSKGLCGRGECGVLKGRANAAGKPRASVFGDPHIYTLDGGKLLGVIGFPRSAEGASFPRVSLDSSRF